MGDPLYYFEQATLDGGWSPCTSREKPGPKKASGAPQYPRVRPDSIVEVPRGLERCTLEELFNVLSPDGKLRGTRS